MLSQLAPVVASADEGFSCAETESKEAQWLRDLFVTDPRYDKQRLEHAKGGILPASCSWVLSQPPFVKWRNNPDSHLLLIEGGPGTGKTMLSCFLIDEIRSNLRKGDKLAYFFGE